ncbi:hypothetical protein CBOM_07818 [Ceraceosorus bombacis]|uniref:Uncharacterized protein n=1 Tax=Ceraceosorus bombacis TaxID=401625 RepID=A0A0P1BIF8_9BASI|nr:hypothetical protein CBOM_07818 [Ceraceosorus bombacis]
MTDVFRRELQQVWRKSGRMYAPYLGDCQVRYCSSRGEDATYFDHLVLWCWTSYEVLDDDDGDLAAVSV